MSTAEHPLACRLGAPSHTRTFPIGSPSADNFSATVPYGNNTDLARRLFERDWDELVGLHSRLSAEAPLCEEREQLLARVETHGFIDDYSGIRIARSGRRFRILQATVWNVLDDRGQRIGQAATFAAWQPLG